MTTPAIPAASTDLAPTISLIDLSRRYAAAWMFNAKFKDLLEGLKADMETAMRSHYASTRSPSTNVDMEGIGEVGKITLVLTQPEVLVVDRDAWTGWVEENHETEVDYPPPPPPVVKVKTAFEKQYLAKTARADYDSGSVFDAQGNVIPGVRAVKGGVPKNITTSGMTKHAETLVAALIGSDGSALRQLLGQEPAGEVPAAVVIDAEPAGVTAEQAQQMKRPELVEALQDRGLDHVGTLAALRARLVAAA